MKKYIIPTFRSACGEIVSGSFSYENKKILVVLVPQGSQLLEYACQMFSKIVNENDLLYVKKSKEIFWRQEKQEFQASRKEMINEIFDNVSSFILNTIENK